MSESLQATVLFFSLFRDLAGAENMKVELPEEPIPLGEVVDRVFAIVPALKEWEGRMLLAVNHQYADRDAEVTAGDEIAMMPPVQGG